MFRYQISFYRNWIEREIIWADSLADAVFTFEQSHPSCEVVAVEKL